MAIYGLQTDFMNKILSEYFGISAPDVTEKEIYIGLGLTQQGSHINTEDFTEVFDGRPFGNYKRARAVFGKANNKQITNINEIVFNTASEDWTTSTTNVIMLGLFDTLNYEEGNKQVKPLVVLKLPTSEVVLKGETVVLFPGAIKLNLTDI